MIIIPRRHYTQPQGRRILAQDKLVEMGFCGGFMFQPEYPAAELLGGELTPSAGGFLEVVGLTPEPDLTGVVGRYWKADSVSRVLSARTGAPSSRAFTMLFRIRLNLAPAISGVVARCSNSLKADGTTIPLWRNGGLFDLRIAGTDYQASGAWNLEQWYEIAVTSGAAGATVIANRQEVLSGAPPASQALPDYIGFGDPAGGGGTSGWFDVDYALICNRALDRREAQEFFDAPYRIFRADPIRIYSLPSGAISLSINSITASNITQTGARITLGLTR